MKSIKVVSVLSVAVVLGLIGCKGKGEEALKACEECKGKGAEVGKCIADVTNKYKDEIGKFSAEQATKWTECASSAAMGAIGDMMKDGMKGLNAPAASHSH